MNSKEAKKLLLKLQPEKIEASCNEDLCTLSTAASEELRKLLKSRRGKVRALEICTALFLLDAELAKRVGAADFYDPVRHDDDEDDVSEDFSEMDAPTMAPGAHVGMAELMSGFDERGTSFRDWSEAQKRETRDARLAALQDLLDYFFMGTKSADEVVTKLLAVTRRLRPQALESFGLSQADVGRRLGVGRATVSAREKRLVEKPLKAAGARGLVSNGARGASTSEACARAAKGNSNRAGKPARRTEIQIILTKPMQRKS